MFDTRLTLALTFEKIKRDQLHVKKNLPYKYKGCSQNGPIKYVNVVNVLM